MLPQILWHWSVPALGRIIDPVQPVGSPARTAANPLREPENLHSPPPLDFENGRGIIRGFCLLFIRWGETPDADHRIEP
jgi:hypothetical protein